MHHRHREAVGSVAALSLVLAILAASSPALAQNGSDKAAAEVLFNQGKALLSDGKFAEACPKLAESLRLDTGIGTMLYLAECYERSGKTASAWAQFREAEAQASKEGDSRAALAKGRADQLEPKLSKLAVVVPAGSEVEGLVVTRDGTSIGRAGWGVDVPVDPGTHVIRASAPGHDPRESTIEVQGNGAPARFVVPALARSAKPVENLGAPSSQSASDGSTQRTVGIGVAAVGLVVAGVGAFFGLRAIATLDDSDAHCNPRACDQEGLDLRDRSQSQANASTILFAVAGVAVAGGAVIWLTAPRRVVLAPMATPSGASFTAAYRF